MICYDINDTIQYDNDLPTVIISWFVGMINKIDECLDEDSDHDPIESCDDYSTDDGLDHDDHHDSLDHDDHHDSLDHDDHRRNSNAPIITITSET